MDYPTFGPCPYCGQRMFFKMHWMSIAIGLFFGTAAALAVMVLA